MKIIDVIKSYTVDEMADFLDEYSMHDSNPWFDWWDENYCSKCMEEISFNPYYGRDCRYAYCELHNNCRHFQDMEEVPDSKQILKMWLETEDY